MVAFYNKGICLFVCPLIVWRDEIAKISSTLNYDMKLVGSKGLLPLQ